MNIDLDSIGLDFKENEKQMLLMEDQEAIIKSGDFSSSIDVNLEGDILSLEDILDILDKQECSSENDVDDNSDMRTENEIEDTSFDKAAHVILNKSENKNENKSLQQDDAFDIPDSLQNHAREDNIISRQIFEEKENKTETLYAKERSVDFQDFKDDKEMAKGTAIHLDDYLYQLLMNSSYWSFIHWTYRERKEFQLLKPMQVANAWGKLKNKRKFTSDSLTREIRNLRKAGKLKKLEGRGCYRFLT